MGPFRIDSEMTIYNNHQKIFVQESPSQVPPGRIPRNIEAILVGDNINKCKPGDEVELIGIFTSLFDYINNIKQGFPLFKTFFEVNYLKKINELEILEITD